MSVQDDKLAGQKDDQQATDTEHDRQSTEKPEPDEEDKKKAAEMMTAYEDDRPTLVLPGSGGMVSGTAVSDWLDEDGNPKYEALDDAGSEEKVKAEADDAKAEKARKEQIEKDKALNEELKKAASAENKGEKNRASS